MSIRERMADALNTTPRKFQVKGVRFLSRRQGNALLGDDMGLGKTFQAIAYVAINASIRPVVVFCPATLKYNWQREFRTHAGIRCDVAAGMTPYPLRRKIWILNYDIALAWLPWLLRQGVGLVILDECQKIMNRTAKRTKAVTALAKTVEQVIGLSGTPIVNRPVEFFPILNLIAPQDFKSFWEYAFRYCNPKRAYRGRGWDFSGASNLAELHERVSRYMLRRMKTEVLTELPTKIRTIIPLDIDNRAEYVKARDDFIDWLTERKGKEAVQRAKGAIALVRVGVLKQIAALGKLKTIVRWVQEWLADSDGGKLILFTVHKKMIRRLMRQFPAAAMIDGSVPPAKRQAIVDRFQTDPRQRVFIGNVKAAGEGITLTAAATTVHTEIGWTPGEHDQADDRVNRIGQTSDRIDSFFFVARDTVEETTLDAIDAKRSVINRVLNGEESDDVTTKIQSLVIDSLLKGRR